MSNVTVINVTQEIISRTDIDPFDTCGCYIYEAIKTAPEEDFATQPIGVNYTIIRAAGRWYKCSPKIEEWQQFFHSLEFDISKVAPLEIVFDHDLLLAYTYCEFEDEEFSGWIKENTHAIKRMTDAHLNEYCGGCP